MKTDIRVLEIEPIFKKEKLYTPLKFGNGVVEENTSLKVRVKVENGFGKVAQGWGNILLSDLWAYPDPLISHEKKDEVMREISRRFCRFIGDSKIFAHPLDFYFEVEEEFFRISQQVRKDLKLTREIPALATLVCASPIDAALHDAFGKVNGISSYEGYGPDFMECDLSRYLGKEFKGKHLSFYIKDDLDEKLPVFHLVGGLDKLEKKERGEKNFKDTLPDSLEEWIEKEGIFCFKVKLRGNDINWDVERTRRVAEVARKMLSKKGKDKFFLSVDFNEMCESPQVVIDYLNKLRKVSPLAFENLLYLEQPTERNLANHNFNMHKAARIKPVLVDEGVTNVAELDLAKKLGWSGIALKTCKGHSSSLLYLAKVKEWKMVYSVQDLTNPGLSFIHSAGLAARISPLKGVEYNARQYLPYAQEEIQKKHQPLFKVKDGEISTSTIKGWGLGYGI